jgi:hypothetical protein
MPFVERLLADRKQIGAIRNDLVGLGEFDD